MPPFPSKADTKEPNIPPHEGRKKARKSYLSNKKIQKGRFSLTTTSKKACSREKMLPKPVGTWGRGVGPLTLTDPANPKPCALSVPYHRADGGLWLSGSRKARRDRTALLVRNPGVVVFFFLLTWFLESILDHVIVLPLLVRDPGVFFFPFI